MLTSNQYLLKNGGSNGSKDLNFKCLSFTLIDRFVFLVNGFTAKDVYESEHVMNVIKFDINIE